MANEMNVIVDDIDVQSITEYRKIKHFEPLYRPTFWELVVKYIMTTKW